MTSAAILYSGSLPAKALTLHCATISSKTFFDNKKNLHPAINVFWEKNHLLNKLKEKQQGSVISGDGRSDSPGHSANYGSYFMLELNINKIMTIPGNLCSNLYSHAYIYMSRMITIQSN